MVNPARTVGCSQGEHVAVATLPSSKNKICSLSVLMVGFMPVSWTVLLNL